MKKPSKAPSKIQQMRDTLAKKKEDRAVPSVGIAYRLSLHETRIEKHLISIDSSFFEIGKELAEIQAEQDFAEDTFEQYIKNRWKKTRSWGYQMIEGYKIKAELPANVQNFVQNQGQAKAISEAPKEKQAEILEAVAKEGKVTAKKITEKIQKQNANEPVEGSFRVIVKDANGDEVPEEIAAEFTRSREETKHIRGLLQEVRRWVEKEEPFKAELSRASTIESVKDAIAATACAAGDYLCPFCKGKGCKVCSKRGFVSKQFYSQSIPDDKK